MNDSESETTFTTLSDSECSCECCHTPTIYTGEITDKMKEDIGDLITNQSPEVTSKIIHFYLNGKDNCYNLCCIRFFIQKSVFRRQMTQPYNGLTSGVIFCTECSAQLDKEHIKELIHMTDESDYDVEYITYQPTGDIVYTDIIFIELILDYMYEYQRHYKVKNECIVNCQVLKHILEKNTDMNVECISVATIGSDNRHSMSFTIGHVALLVNNVLFDPSYQVAGLKNVEYFSDYEEYKTFHNSISSYRLTQKNQKTFKRFCKIASHVNNCSYTFIPLFEGTDIFMEQLLFVNQMWDEIKI